MNLKNFGAAPRKSRSATVPVCRGPGVRPQKHAPGRFVRQTRLFHAEEALHALEVHEVGLVDQDALRAAKRAVALVCVVCDDMSNRRAAPVTQGDHRAGERMSQVLAHLGFDRLPVGIYNAMPEEGVDTLIAFMKKFEKEHQ